MLAVKKPTHRPARRARASGQAFAADSARRIGAFVLARPGTVALTLLFGGLGAAISANALWMQSAHHPAPLFKQAALQPPPRPPVRKVMEEEVAAPAAATATDSEITVLPPERPAGLGRSVERGPPVPAKPVAGKRPKDPIGDLLGGTAPVPPAPIKPGASKAETIEKTERPAPAPAQDAIATLIEQTTKSR